MNKALLITTIVCLGVPFILSFRSDCSRTYRRRALAVGFCVMLAVAIFLPPDTKISSTRGNVNAEESLTMQEDTEERVPATWCAASEVDLSGYSVVGCTEMTASNYLEASLKSYPVQNAFDGDPATCWQDGVEGNGEGTEISVTLSESCNLQYIVIYNGQTTSEEKFRNNGRVGQMEIENGQFTEMVELSDENTPVAIKLDGWENVSSVTFKINSVYPGSKYLDTCISEIVFYR